jgi:hypothetical protein
MRVAALLALPCLACAPPLADTPWLVSAPRVVGVTAEPPEAAPGATVALRAVVAGPSGPVDDAGVRWARCDEPRPFSQNEPVNLDCLAALADAGPGPPTLALALPADDCARFGPDAPSAGARPRDADATGGYFHPVGVQVGGAPGFAFVRLSCPPAGVSFDVARAYAQAARPNTNPRATVRATTAAGEALDLQALPKGAEVALEADWSATPPETFALIDAATGALATQLETYDVSWLVTAGELASARSSTGRGRWTLPSDAGQGTLWVVVRDSRGGVGVSVVAARWR